MSDEETADLTSRCDLCAMLRRLRNPPNNRRASSGSGRGLRIALVDDDEGTGVSLRKMVHAQSNGWNLDTYHPPCLALDASSPARLSRRSGEEARQTSGIPPEIVLIGLTGSGLSWLVCVRRLKALSPDGPLLIISGQCDRASILHACMAGADGFLLKSITPEELVRALSSAAQGVPVLCDEAQKALMHFLHRAGRSLSSHDLTPREQEIVSCLAATLSNKEICERLCMEMNTLHVHLVHLFRKLGVHNRRQAFRKLLPQGEQ